MDATISFGDIRFQERENGVRAMFLGRYHFDLTKEELDAIAPATVKDGALVFHGIDEDHAWKRFDPLLEKGFRRLTHINYSKPTVYIHRNSGIPLIGTNEFGIVDRGTNIIEIKPLTGCNLQCPYCSVDEGKNDKTHDYVVECKYLVEEAAKVAAGKTHPVEFHIGPQGEPMLYPKFAELVRGLRAIPNCARVTVVTNGTLLTEKLIDELAAAGLTKINLSLNALSQETANAMSGRTYPVQHVLRMIKYAEGKIRVMVAPTIVPGWNDHEMEGLVQLGTTMKDPLPLGFQNFLVYPKGRNPVKKQRPWEEFEAMLLPLQEKHGVRLTGLQNEDLHITEEPELPKPFRKNDTVKARVVCPARYLGEIVAAAEGRCITVIGPHAEELPIGREVKVKIVRDKHNIYKGTL